MNGIEIDFSGTCGIAVGGSKLLVSDAGRNRVLVWGFPPTSNGEMASFALVQPNFTSTAAGNGRTQLRTPGGVWTDGTKLLVADTRNNRVLVWYSFPATNQDAPALVLGQPDFGLGDAPVLPSASRMSGPQCVYSDGNRIFVSDSGHRRVLVWSTLPASNGTPADIVIGQPDFVSSASGTGASQLSDPAGLAMVSGALLVVDSGNNRVQVFDRGQLVTGMAATESLGQFAPDQVAPHSTSASALSGPTGLAVNGSRLYVADQSHHRVLGFLLGR